jgi:ABC-2 type transport system ATP-binding protein
MGGIELIEVENLTKSYGKNTAISNLNFKIESGEIVGFLGKNGAGKSTTMNIITGVIPPDDGTVRVCGYDISKNSKDVKKLIGYLPELPPLCTYMTVSEYLNFVSELKLVNKRVRKSELDDIMELIRISDVRGRLIRNLSKGYRQRIGLAQALIGNPEVLILDEPTVGLDPTQIIEIRKIIKPFGKQHTIMLSSHILSEISAICDRVIIINEGKIAAINTTENLKNESKIVSKISVNIIGNKDYVLQHINKINGVKCINVNDKKGKDNIVYILEVENEIEAIKQINIIMATNGYIILELKSIDLSLEDVFVELVKEEKGD